MEYVGLLTVGSLKPVKGTWSDAIQRRTVMGPIDGTGLVRIGQDSSHRHLPLCHFARGEHATIPGARATHTSSFCKQFLSSNCWHDHRNGNRTMSQQLIPFADQMEMVAPSNIWHQPGCINSHPAVVEPFCHLPQSSFTCPWSFVSKVNLFLGRVWQINR